MLDKAVGLTLASFLLMLAFSAMPFATAQVNYDFELEAEYVDVFINKDGSVGITYEFHFINHGQLDGVDIGLPNEHYDLATAAAAVVIDGQSFTPAQIHTSPWIETGVAVEFTGQIRSLIEVPGQEFILMFTIRNERMVWENELVEGGVGVHFKPTWFSPDFQRGNTGYLRARIFFPPGFSNITEAVYLYNQPWDSIEFNSSLGLAMATWEADDIDLYQQADGYYNFGAGLPSAYVDKFYSETIWDRAGAVLASLGDFLCANICCLIPAILVTFVISYQLWWNKRKKDYFKPHMTVAGAGPRRGLTAPEAAIVLERPLDMVATMILFGMTRKGLVTAVPVGQGFKLVKNIGAKHDRAYERKFLEAIDDMGLVNPKALENLMTDLIRDVRQKLVGFDHDATKKYYGVICEKAWKQVQDAGTPGMVVGTLEEQNEWLMLDRDYDNRMNTFWVYHPVFMHRPMQSSKGAPINIQGVAQGYVARVKSTSNSLVSNIESFSAAVTGRTNKATNILGEAAKALTAMESGSAGGFKGGGGGGCACACACACAGGGR